MFSNFTNIYFGQIYLQILTNTFWNGRMHPGECALEVPTCWIKFWIWILEWMEASPMQIWRLFRWKIKISHMFQNIFGFFPFKGIDRPWTSVHKNAQPFNGSIRHAAENSKYILHWGATILKTIKQWFSFV